MIQKGLVLKLSEYDNARIGLRELGELAYSIRQIMEARVDTPVIEKGNGWQTLVDSKTMTFYGGVNEDGWNRFKIDHGADISSIVNLQGSSLPCGTLSIDEKTYMQSQGTEFIIIDMEKKKRFRSRGNYQGKRDLYAIKADEYGSIRDQLNEGWIELAVGKNNASKEDYIKAAEFLKEKFVPQAVNHNCFREDEGMGFGVTSNQDHFRVGHWCIYASEDKGKYFAGGWGGFFLGGRFLTEYSNSIE